MNKEIKDLIEKITYIEENISNDDSGEVTDLYFKTKENIDSLFQMVEGANLGILKKQARRLSDIGKYYGFDDPEGDLDTMFPDRHDDDFDEDSTPQMQDIMQQLYWESKANNGLTSEQILNKAKALRGCIYPKTIGENEKEFHEVGFNYEIVFKDPQFCGWLLTK